MKKLTLSLLLLSITALGIAQTAQWYQVELIIFQQPQSDGISNEMWPQNPPLPALKNTVQLLPSASMLDQNTLTSPAVNYQLLPPSESILQTDLAKLKKHYRILMHVAWLQQLRHEQRTIHLFGGTAYTADAKPIAYPSPRPPQMANTQPDDMMTIQGSPDDGAMGITMVPSKWEIDGTIQVSASRYIIVRSDLLFTQPSQNLASGDQQSAFTSFRLKQAARMPRDELHYLDNPAFGVLVKVVRYTPVENTVVEPAST